MTTPRAETDEPLRLPNILVVDDSPDVLRILGDLLTPQYRVRIANNGQRALQLALRDPRPDLILLDVMMPELNGYSVLARLKADAATGDIPVIFLTSMDATEDEQRGLEQGAADYITKPIRPAIVLARVHTHLELKFARDHLRDQNTNLEAEVLRRIAENQLTQDVSIYALAHLAETRDPETGNHIRRTQEYVGILARHLKHHPRFAPSLSDTALRLLIKSAPLHDIGKVGIPDHVLLKPGKLTQEEWEIMQTHAQLGAQAIEQAESDSQDSVAFLTIAKEIAHWHHERWDGFGYPDGLKGDDIPVSARLMALADVFDALISKRVYKPAFSFDKARDMIIEGRAKHFDPDVVDAFLANYDAFVTTATRYRDAGQDDVAPTPAPIEMQFGRG